MNGKFIRHFVNHLLIVSLFICYEITIIAFMGSAISLQYFLPYYIPDLLLFYLHALLVMRLWTRDHKSFALLLIVLEFFGHFGIYLWIDNMVSHRHFSETKITDSIRVAYRSIYVFGISMAYWVVLRNQKQAKEIYELKLQALELQNRQVILENAFLRAQADPHLIFNVLNVLHGALEKKMPEEAEAVKTLCDTMDFALRRVGEDGKITLLEEIELTQKKIALYQFLNRGAFQIKFAVMVPADNTALRIPPLVLATLVDNLFMHGDLTDENHPGTVKISSKGSQLSITLSNRIARHQRTSHGLGMEFVRRCLSFYYPDQFNLSLATENNTYLLHLNIEL